jgi:hypothetical protein
MRRAFAVAVERGKNLVRIICKINNKNIGLLFVRMLAIEARNSLNRVNVRNSFIRRAMY